MKLGLVLLLIIICSFEAYCQIVINELMASNTGSIVDPDNGESADWIELYNSGNESVDLSGYYLTDNISDPKKWQFKTTTTIESKGFLLIWADGIDSGLHTNYKLSADGEELALVNPIGEIVDSLLFGLQEPNISMGRKTDGASELVFFDNPTPGKTNNSNYYSGIVRNAPDFLPFGGIYDQPMRVALKNTFGGILRYTTDGSAPTDSSLIYTEPISVVQHMVLRARIFKEGEMPGPIITHSYFIDPEHRIGTLPVVSIASNSENFWDKDKGIYVQNFKPEWEIPINIELFENDGSDRAGFNVPAGTKVNGLYSWQLPQKMLGIYFRKEYGEGKLDYPLFFDRDRRLFDSFALRASGSDWAYTLFRDGMIQQSTAINMDLEIQGFRAVVLFVNGQYMGIHNIRSKVDEDYIAENCDMGDTAFDMIANEAEVEVGTLENYNVFKALYKKDLSIQSNFDAVANEMDMENFTDYIITEVYSGNSSISHNVMCWKPQVGGKWRWLLTDLDRGFFNPENYLIDYSLKQTVWPFSALMKNAKYKEYFGYRLADHLFTTFHQKRMNGVVNSYANDIDAEISNHVKRWKGTSSSYGNPISSYNNWLTQVEILRTFVNKRPDVLLDNLKNYGLKEPLGLSMVVFPAGAGSLTFNGLKIIEDATAGAYPRDGKIAMKAEPNGGYDFIGWGVLQDTILITKESVWKYNDNGTALSSDWKNIGFSDESWSEGKAELGYGDGNESTTIRYGSSSSNKRTSYYFRKSFEVENINDLLGIKLGLLYDDGAVVYLNGNEVLRINMPAGIIEYSTLANSSVGDDDETTFRSFTIDASMLKAGKNVVAVEVHQNSVTSSDVSFDMELAAWIGGSNSLITSEKEYSFVMNQERNIVAFFKRNDKCILPSTISSNMFLSKSCSPYYAQGNVTIDNDVTLTVGSGVEVRMPDNANIFVKGTLVSNGIENDPVRFVSVPSAIEKKWGAICFENATGTSILRNTIIEDASQGPHPIKNVAAISVFHSKLMMDKLHIENVWSNPIAARYSDITLTNSYLYSKVTGDLVNVKYGNGWIENSEFVGNEKVDTDAIDYDDVVNGGIKNCIIHDFNGLNSDAIDIGEKAKNILIDGIFVYNVTDKGVSVGQQSTVEIKNSVFVNCNLGAGLKDSSRVIIDHCTFYGCAIPVSSFEKNAGSAGGNVLVTNSILSNSYEQTFLCDNQSTLMIRNSISDNDLLPSGSSNLFGNPQFVDPGTFQFSLKENSPAKNASTGSMGATLTPWKLHSMVEISAICYKAENNVGVEFIQISNPGGISVDLSGFQITKGIAYTFPEGTVIPAKSHLILSERLNADEWQQSAIPILQWESGKLSDEGESIRLVNKSGIIFDQVTYGLYNPWPFVSSSGQVLVLKNRGVDNHFGDNWEVGSIADILNEYHEIKKDGFSVFPNPTKKVLYISGLNDGKASIYIYDLAGVEVARCRYEGNENAEISLENLKNGFYVLRYGNRSVKIIKH